MRVPGEYLQFAVIPEREFALEQQQVIAAIIGDGGISSIPVTGHREGVIQRTGPPAPAEEPIRDPVVTACGLGRPAGILRRTAGLNVNHRRQRIGTVGGGAGTSDDLDAFDVLQWNGQVIPIDAAVRILKDALAVDQDQHPPGKLIR